MSRLIRPSVRLDLVPSNPSVCTVVAVRRETLIQAVDTCLSSKVVSQNCETISPMAVDAVMGIIDPVTATNVDLRDIKASRRSFTYK